MKDILAVVVKYRCTANHIANELQLENRDVSRMLQTLKRRGLVVNHGMLWYATAKGVSMDGLI